MYIILSINKSKNNFCFSFSISQETINSPADDNSFQQILTKLLATILFTFVFTQMIDVNSKEFIVGYYFISGQLINI
jgi:hypothetical protein